MYRPQGLWENIRIRTILNPNLIYRYTRASVIFMRINALIAAMHLCRVSMCIANSIKW